MKSTWSWFWWISNYQTFKACGFCVIIKKIVHNPGSKRISPKLHNFRFYVKVYDPCYVNIYDWHQVRVKVNFFYIRYPVVLTAFTEKKKKLSSPEWVTFASLSKIIKKNEIMPLAATWMDLEIIILTEVRQWKSNII